MMKVLTENLEQSVGKELSARVAEKLSYTYVEGPSDSMIFDGTPIMAVAGFQDKKRLLLDTEYLRKRVL